MMEVVVTTGAIGHAKLQYCHHQHTSTQLFTGVMPFLYPNQLMPFLYLNQQCQSTEDITALSCYILL